MKTALAVVTIASQVTYYLLTIVVFVQWWRHRGLQWFYLFSALGCLAIITPLGALLPHTSGPVYYVLYLVNLTLFMGSGYALLLFRGTLVPIGRRTFWVVTGIAAITIALTATAGIPSGSRVHLTTYQTACIYSLIGVWFGCILEPVVRLWIVSARMSAVQKARARALSLGYGSLLGLIVIAIGVSVAGVDTTNPAISLTFSLLFFAFIGILYVSFIPPAWIRRLWRASEEEAFSAALRNLLLYSHDVHEISERATLWAVRLLGAENSIVVDKDSEILAVENLSREDAAAAVSQVAADHGRHTVKVPGRRQQTAIVAALPMDGGHGRIFALSGSWTPIFGTEEEERLNNYATAVTAALERVHLVVGIRALNVELEDRVRSRTAELEAANRELEAFSYSVSHDLRAPLRAISGFAGIVTTEHGKELSSESRRYLDLISQNTNRMGQLIDDLLIFSRLSRQELKLSRVDVEAVAREAYASLTQAQSERSVDFRVETLPPAMGDSALLRQVFINLVSNALKFTRTRRVATIEITGAPSPEAGFNTYSVADNGVGFDMEYKDQLFGVFHRLHPTEEYEGTGVGLAIVERIVTRLGGKVWADAKVGKGATFHIQLRAIRA